jgi:glycerol-3-phosphate dehydrogenase (NAD(P)+)
VTDSNPLYRRAAVIGAGAWGTTLALLLAQRGLPVMLWAYEAPVVDAIRRKHENVQFLPGISLPPDLRATSSLEEAIHEADLLIFAVPSHAARSVLTRLAPLLTKPLSKPLPIISATKGIEEGTLALMSDVIQQTLPGPRRHTIAVLSGPSFASEVAKGQPTAVVLASQDHEATQRLQALLMTGQFRVYTGTDVIGVQLGAALKNVVAIAAGVVDGLGLGHNARAALITRGLAEMIRLGVAMGADIRTFYGLAGMGDLVLTCTGPLSRNHGVGMRLGKGDQLTTILGDTHTVAEGIHTSRAALGLANRFGVEMPIVQEVCAVLFDGKSPSTAVADLMERAGKAETT